MPRYRTTTVAEGVTLHINQDDAADFHVRLELSPREVFALEHGAGSEKIAAAADAVRRATSNEAQADAFLALPQGADASTRLDAWLGTLSRHQRIVIDYLRGERRNDSSRSEQYKIVGVDERGRPVLQKPERWSGGTMRWAVLRNGDPTDVTGPIKPIGAVLDELVAAGA